MQTALANIHDLSRRFGLPARWFREEAEAGRLPCLRVGDRFLFNVAAVERALAIALLSRRGRHALMPEPAADQSNATIELAALLRRVLQSLDAAPSDDAEGLSPAAAAKFLGISVSALHDLNSRGWVPEPANLGDGRLPRYSKSVLRAWLASGAPHRSRWASMQSAVVRRVG